MAFSQRRGRPPQPRAETTDHGTPELQFKRALGTTIEPIDACLERGIITSEQHRSGLHLRWLYTLRYGAPVVTTYYTDPETLGSAPDDPAWRSQREQEYHEAVALLHRHRRYEPVMRLCVYNERPAFLNPALTARSAREPALAERIAQTHRQLLEGLEILVSHWKHP